MQISSTAGRGIITLSTKEMNDLFQLVALSQPALLVWEKSSDESIRARAAELTKTVGTLADALQAASREMMLTLRSTNHGE